MTILKTAILGCGSFAHRHAGYISQLGDDLQLVAFCDRNLHKSEAFSEQYTGGNASAYTDHRKMMEETLLDLLFICLPPFAHTDEVELAAQRGIHIFIEKPIALRSEDAWQMVKVTESAGIKTQVGFMFRFGTAIDELKRMIESGEAGRVGLMTARYFCNSLHSYWWRDREKSGGQLVEQVIHMFDLMRYIMGDPVSVYSRQENIFHKDVADYTVEDVSATVVTFAGGAMGTINATNGAIPNKWINDYRIVAQNVVAEFTDANHALFHHTDDVNRAPTQIDSDRSFYIEEIRDLIQAIRTDGKTRTPMREGAKSLDLVLAARRSAEEGIAINL